MIRPELGGWSDVPVFGDAPSGGAAVRRDSGYTIIRGAAASIAVVRTPKGVFLPGGGVDDEEPLTDAVHREVREECGLAIRLGDWRTRAIEFVHSPAEGKTFEKRSTFFDATVTATSTGAVEPDHELQWLTVENAAATLTPPSHRWAIAQWRATPTSGS